MKIVFIGATGMLGKPVARELIDSGFDLRLLGRHENNLRQHFPGTDIVNADVFNEESLQRSFVHADIVYVNLSVDPASKEKDLQPEREGVKNIIAAAKENNVKRIVYLSSLIKNYQGMNGFKWWSFDIKQKAVDAVKSSGIRYTIFYPSTFMETLTHQLMRGKRIMLLGDSIAPMWFIAAADYAKQVSRSLQISTDENKEYPVQGPDPLTFDEAVKILIENNKKRKLKSTKIPMAPIKFLAKFNQKMDYGVRICEALNKYPEKFESENTWNELGRPKISLQEYAKSF